MSQSHEPSYYEIALTNRQVLIVFVVLLVCVVAAFFSGVWVGRREAPAPGMIVAEEGGSDTAPETEDGSAVGELHFFSDDQSPQDETPSLAEMADEPQTETTLLEDLGGSEQVSEVAADPEPPAPAPVAATRTEASAAASTPATSGYVIQVFSSADEEQARRLLRQLTDGGYPAFLSPVEVGSQTMVRVRIGPYSQLANAETVADRIQREFKLDTWVTQ